MATIPTPQALLQRLIAFNTTSHLSNQQMAHDIAEMLTTAGARVYQVAGDEPGKVNLLAQVGPERADGCGLTLCGHMDVVPANEPGWHSDPFVLTTRDDRFVGRGTADMKGFVALAVHAMCELAQRGVALRKPLCLLLTHDEEIGAVGMQQMLARGEGAWPCRVPREVLVGEPTSLVPIRMHKGHLKVRVAVRGVSAHSGFPHLGVNAIEPMAGVIQALAALRESLASMRVETSEHFPDSPYPALNMATIRGGSAMNVVPETCEMQVGLRLLPGMESGPWIARVKDAVAQGFGTQQATMTFELINDNPPMLTEAPVPLVQLLERMTGKSAGAASFASDGGPLSQAGYQCVLWGPGSIEVAHKPNEWLPRAEWQQAGVMLQHIIEHYVLQN